MSSDSDPIKPAGRSPDDITSIILDAVMSVQYKFLGLMAIMFLFLSSDVFTNRILSKIVGAVDYKCATSYGEVIKMLFLVLFMVIFDVFIRQKII